MTTLGQCLQQYRRAVAASGEPPPPGPPVLIEARVQEEQALNSLEGRKAAWSTQLFALRAVQEQSSQETERVDKMKALLALVCESCRVFFIQKAGENPSDNVCIGRAKRNDVLLADNTVSSVHARIEYVGDRLHLTDLKSSNGTWVNKERLSSESVPLMSGDCVRFGRRVLYYLSGERLAQLLELMARTDVSLVD